MQTIDLMEIKLMLLLILYYIATSAVIFIFKQFQVKIKPIQLVNTKNTLKWSNIIIER